MLLNGLGLGLAVDLAADGPRDDSDSRRVSLDQDSLLLLLNLLLNVGK
jgi:hypothetical protein